MRKRNFKCPETEDACTDGRCTKQRCCEREKLQIAEKAEAVAKKTRIETAEVWEIIAPLFLKPKSDQ